MNIIQIELDVIIDDHITLKQTFQHKVVMYDEIMDMIEEFVFKNGKFKVREIKITSIKIFQSCHGCQTDQPNQLAHMYKGGCLYDSEENL